MTAAWGFQLEHTAGKGSADSADSVRSCLKVRERKWILSRSNADYSARGPNFLHWLRQK